jgi:ribosomal protein S4
MRRFLDSQTSLPLHLPSIMTGLQKRTRCYRRRSIDPMTTDLTPPNAIDRMTERLDRELVRRGIARSRGQAQTMISAGQVLVDGLVVERTDERVTASAAIEAPVDHYVRPIS